jgi:hypothetical protein
VAIFILNYSLWVGTRDLNLLSPPRSRLEGRNSGLNDCQPADTTTGASSIWHLCPVGLQLFPGFRSPDISRGLVLSPVELWFLGPDIPETGFCTRIAQINSQHTLLLPRAGLISTVVRKFEHYSSIVVCPFCPTEDSLGMAYFEDNEYY